MSLVSQLEKGEDSWVRRNIAGDYTHIQKGKRINGGMQSVGSSGNFKLATCDSFELPWMYQGQNNHKTAWGPDLESRGASFRLDGEAQGDPAAQGFLQALLHLCHLQFQVDPLLLLLPAVLLNLLQSLRQRGV